MFPEGKRRYDSQTFSKAYQALEETLPSVKSSIISNPNVENFTQLGDSDGEPVENQFTFKIGKARVIMMLNEWAPEIDFTILNAGELNITDLSSTHITQVAEVLSDVINAVRDRLELKSYFDYHKHKTFGVIDSVGWILKPDYRNFGSPIETA